MSKDSEIKAVADELDRLLDQLAVNVTALNHILTKPAPPGPGQDERLIKP